jgi:hypothetical protein
MEVKSFKAAVKLSIEKKKIEDYLEVFERFEKSFKKGDRGKICDIYLKIEHAKALTDFTKKQLEDIDKQIEEL